MSTREHDELTATGYSVGMSKIAVEHRADHNVVVACGHNLDAPQFLLSGGLFWAPLCQEALPAIAAVVR